VDRHRPNVDVEKADSGVCGAGAPRARGLEKVVQLAAIVSLEEALDVTTNLTCGARVQVLAGVDETVAEILVQPEYQLGVLL
jgi:hypothetical protein